MTSEYKFYSIFWNKSYTTKVVQNHVYMPLLKSHNLLRSITIFQNVQINKLIIKFLYLNSTTSALPSRPTHISHVPHVYLTPLRSQTCTGILSRVWLTFPEWLAYTYARKSKHSSTHENDATIYVYKTSYSWEQT